MICIPEGHLKSNFELLSYFPKHKHLRTLGTEYVFLKKYYITQGYENV